MPTPVRKLPSATGCAGTKITKGQTPTHRAAESAGTHNNGGDLIDGRGLSPLVHIAAAVSAPALPPVNNDSKVKPLRLKVRHRRMIALHLQGLSNTEIAHILGCHAATVGAVIRNPTARIILDQAFKEHEQGLRALVPLGILAIRDGLVANDTRVRLQAVDRLNKSLERSAESGVQTAEDVVRRIISLRNGDTEVQIAEEIRR